MEALELSLFVYFTKTRDAQVHCILPLCSWVVYAALMGNNESKQDEHASKAVCLFLASATDVLQKAATRAGFISGSLSIFLP